MTTLILVPTTDYKTEDTVKSAWETGADFIIRTIGVRGTYASIRDMDAIKEQFDRVYIRYNGVAEIYVAWEKESDQSNGYVE